MKRRIIFHPRAAQEAIQATKGDTLRDRRIEAALESIRNRTETKNTGRYRGEPAAIIEVDPQTSIFYKDTPSLATVFLVGMVQTDEDF